MFIRDTPLWYRPPVGPVVEVTMSYNSQESVIQNSPFGNKWMFNYASYVVEDTAYGGGVVTVFMPDGSQANYTPNDSGGYTPPVGIYNTLRKLSETRYELESQGGDKAIYDIPTGTTSLQPFLVAFQDRFGYGLSFGYDSNVHLTTITDAQGKVTRLEYDALGHIVKAWDPFGRQASFRYDPNGNMVEVIDIEGQAFQYTYDANILVTRLNTAQGPWQFQHRIPGRDTWQQMYLTITDPMNYQETYGYDGTGGPVYYIDKRGNRTNRIVGAVIGNEGQVTRTEYLNGSGEGSAVLSSETTQYDYTTGRPIAFTDAGGKTTRVSYNGQGQVTSVTDRAGHTTTYQYAPNGIDMTRVVNALGQTTSSSTYDAYHRILTHTDALGDTTAYTYTAWGAVAQLTNSAGHTTTYNYDLNTKRLVSTTRNGATSASYTHDALGRVRTSTDASGLTLTYEYNNLDRVTRVRYPDGTFIATEYVCCDLPGVVTDRAGRKTFYDYDPLKRVTRLQDALGHSAHLEYDPEW